MQYKCEFRIRLWNFETTHKIDLPCYWLNSFLEESTTQTPESESVTVFIPFLKNQRLKRQNQNQHERSQGEHPEGDRWFSSNGQTTATTQTNPGRQLSAGLCIPDSMADPWFKVSRLSGLPSWNSKRSFWLNAKGSLSSLSSNVLCLFFCVFSTGFCFYEGKKVAVAPATRTRNL